MSFREGAAATISSEIMGRGATDMLLRDGATDMLLRDGATGGTLKDGTCARSITTPLTTMGVPSLGDRGRIGLRKGAADAGASISLP